jgi:hypothetical protein
VLHPDVVARLTEWLERSKREASDILFPVSGKVPGGIERKTSQMMRRDLAAARETWIENAPTEDDRLLRRKSDFLRYKDSQGRYADFHANRHTFITNLGRAGVNPKTAQTLARHSDIRLTMNIYSHTDLLEKTEAVRRLPGLWECFSWGSAPESQDGTNGQKTSRKAERGEEDPDSKGSSEVLAASGLAADGQQDSAAGRSTPEGIRTPNPRFRRQSPNSRRKALKTAKK